MPEMKNAKEFYGHLITRDGKITRIDGKRVKIRNKSILTYFDGDRMRYKNIAVIVYELFTGVTLDRSSILLFKDGNDKNFAFDNIKVIPKKGRYCYSMFTEEQTRDIQSEYHKDDTCQEEKKKNNYRSNSTEFSSYRKLATKYGCSLSTITKILNGTYRAACE